MLNAFSVDVEDYFQVSGFERHIARSAWDQQECRVVASTRRVLSLLARHQVRATFFVLGWVADRFPELVGEIVEEGHEIGSHSYWHRLVYDLSPDEFRDDLVKSCNALRRAGAREVSAFRAPSFSITQRSLWALNVLAEEGFRLDSSIFPARHPRYGIPAARQEPHRIETSAGAVWEFPLAVRRYAGCNLAVAGGGYFRLYPLGFTCRALADINRAGRPFVFYIHPWELDPGQPRLRAGDWASRWRHYVNLSHTEAKLDKLLSRFRFGTLTEVLEVGVHESAA